MPELESSMNQVQVEQKSYQMPPQDGFTVALFLTVAAKGAVWQATSLELLTPTDHVRPAPVRFSSSP
jgi:hypothetical protein